MMIGGMRVGLRGALLIVGLLTRWAAVRLLIAWP
jgi:uncharacterized membrane protein YphA (DoxX/SURF4 family)